MPIVSKVFDYKRLQRNGMWNVRERHTDSAGRNYHFPYRANSEADADAKMAARDGAAMIRETEEQELVAHIEQGGTPDSYVATELSTVQKQRHAYQRFILNDMTDRIFICSMGDYVSDFSAPQIANAAQISNTKAAKVRTRAIRLRNVICPALIEDEDDLRELS